MKKLTKFISLLAISFLLCGCKSVSTNSTLSSAATTDSSDTNTSSDPGTSADSSTTDSSSTSYPNIEKQESSLKGKDWFKFYGESQNCRAFPSTGEQNVLVVPLMFKGDIKPQSTLSNSVINDITKAYVGDEDETSYYSVKDYYERVSYGQLKLNINVVQKWCTLDKRLDELYAVDTNIYADQSWYAVDYVTNWYKTNYDDIAKYDNDKDGYIDSLIIVFGHKAYTMKEWPYLDGAPTEAEKKLCWAYTFWKYKDEPGTLESPVPNAYNWISYEYTTEGDYKKPNPHTYIHEFGHILGLDDYYDYDYQEDGTRFSPAGQVNMQDYNLGDQDSYSKYLLDWTQPTIVDKPGEITIKPFESSGDCVLIPASNNFDNSPLDEYLLIDLYTPTGVNEKDANELKRHLFTKSGIKVYHVDSRVGKIHYNEETKANTFNSYIDNPTYESLKEIAVDPYYVDIVASNTESYCTNGTEYKELNLLSSAKGSVNNYYYPDCGATDDDLYQIGDGVYSFTFNNGSSLRFSMSVTSLNNESATLVFQQL